MFLLSDEIVPVKHLCNKRFLVLKKIKRKISSHFHINCTLCDIPTVSKMHQTKNSNNALKKASKNSIGNLIYPIIVNHCYVLKVSTLEKSKDIKIL